MDRRFGMDPSEFRFGVIMASVHAGQHLFLRLFPPLIPILVIDLEATLWQLGLLVTVYMFAGGLFQAPMGVLSDRYDRRYLLVPAFVAMGIGYLIFLSGATVGDGLATVHIGGHGFDGQFQVMAVGMFVAGVGYSAIHPVGVPLISTNVSSEHHGKALGMWGSASKIGDTIAPLVIGVFIIVLPWEHILFGISLFGFVFAGWLFLVFRSGEFETAPAGVDRDDDRSDEPLSWRHHPRRLLLPITFVLFSFYFIMFAGNGLMTFTPVFVADVYGFSFDAIGVRFGPESVANFYFGTLLISGALAQLVIGDVTDRHDSRIVLILLLAVSALGLFVLAAVTLTPVTLLLVLLLIGATLFGLAPARDSLIIEITPDRYEGRTFGYIWTLALVGSSIYPFVIGYLADTIGLRFSFGVLAVGAIGGVLCIGLLFSPAISNRRPLALPRVGRRDRYLPDRQSPNPY